jgi:hypothetical protein
MEVSQIYIPDDILKCITINLNPETLVIMTFVSTRMKKFIIRHFPQVRCSQFSLFRYGIKNNYRTMIVWAIGIERYTLKENWTLDINMKKYLDELDELYRYDTKYLEYKVCKIIYHVASILGHLHVIKWLYKNNTIIEDYVLVNSTTYGHLDIIKWFFANVHPTRRGVYGNYEYIMVLNLATMHGHLNII